MTTAPISHTVPPHLDGIRVDLAVAELFETSRARAKTLAEEGRVKIDGKRVRKGVRVEAGQVLALDEPPPPADFEALADPDAPLVVVHEDDACVIVDKPAGQPSHPLRPDEKGTVANALVARFPSMRGVGFAPREPGLVHRLDNDTSGLLLAAKNAGAFDTLVEALRAGRVDKRYLALCAGEVRAPQTIASPIAHHDARKMRVADAGEKGARAARTEVLTSRPIEGGSLVEVPRTTRGVIRCVCTSPRSDTRSSLTRSTAVRRSRGSRATRCTRRSSRSRGRAGTSTCRARCLRISRASSSEARSA